MKFAVVLALSFGATNAQLVCNVLPSVGASAGIQQDECCAAALIHISALFISWGAPQYAGGQCLHMNQYSQYFPEGCTDCTGPYDSQMKCVPGITPTVEVTDAARQVLCCNNYEFYGRGGQLCKSAILAGMQTQMPSNPGDLFSVFESDFLRCSDVTCGGPPPPRTFSPTKSPTSCEDTVGYVDSKGYSCSSYIGQDCLNDKMLFTLWGYSSDEWQDIMNNCLVSCGLCQEKDVTTTSHTTAPTKPPLIKAAPTTAPTKDGATKAPTKAPPCRDCTNTAANRKLLFARLPCCSN
jgi:hypothetical protein